MLSIRDEAFSLPALEAAAPDESFALLTDTACADSGLKCRYCWRDFCLSSAVFKNDDIRSVLTCFSITSSNMILVIPRKSMAAGFSPSIS